MLRVNCGVLVVPPFECAWLTGNEFTLRGGAGCLSFEAKGDTDITIIFKSTPGAKRLQPLQRAAVPGGGNALQVEQNYTVILGSHRNSCLKFEKNNVTQRMVQDVPGSRVSGKEFARYWIDVNHGAITVGRGEPGEAISFQWRDAQEIPNIQHIGLSCWDRHVSYRSISLHPPLDFQRLQAQLDDPHPRMPPLLELTAAAVMQSISPDNACRALQVSELLLPTTQKLYRFCLDFLARHFEVMAREQQQQLNTLSAAAMCDLMCQNAFSVDEREIYAAVRAWAHAAATAGVDGVGIVVGGAEGEAGGEALLPACSMPLLHAAGNADAAPASSPSSAPAGAACERLSAQAAADDADQDAFGRAASAPAPLSADVTRAGGVQSPTSPAASQAPDPEPADADAAAAADADAYPALGSHPGLVAVISRVLGLIRYPLLPISDLLACLRDPLLRRLPLVLGVLHEVLEVHQRETSGPLASPSACRTLSGSCQAQAADQRRLVKPIAASAASGATPGVAVAGGASGVVAAGDAASAMGMGMGAGAGGWSVRYQRRCLPFCQELLYTCDGDEGGALHFIGTQYGKQSWINPLLAKRVDVKASSPTSRTTDPRVVVGRQFVRTNFAGPRFVNGEPLCWWQIDLGEPHQLVLNYYTLRHDGSHDYARSWVVQGSLDLVNWVDLKRHVSDTTLKVPGQYASWPVIGPAASVPYRAFRLLLTGPNASPNAPSRNNFCLSYLELYGYLYRSEGGTAGGGGAGAAPQRVVGAATAAGGQGGEAAGSGAATAAAATFALAGAVQARPATPGARACDAGRRSFG